MVFEKPPERVGCNNNRARQQTQKTFAKTLQILLRKHRPAYAIASNNR
jgi:hypothetical protein